MGFKKGIEKCVECEKKMSEDPDETGMCSKCGSGARVDSEIQKELNDALYHIERNGNAKIILLDLSMKLTRFLHKKEKKI